jgi:hypothetical protein
MPQSTCRWNRAAVCVVEGNWEDRLRDEVASEPEALLCGEIESLTASIRENGLTLKVVSISTGRVSLPWKGHRVRLHLVLFEIAAEPNGTAPVAP